MRLTCPAIQNIFLSEIIYKLKHPPKINTGVPKQVERNKYNALLLMIKFCMFEDDCFPILKNYFGEDIYNTAIDNYKSNHKRYVHRYVAISHIYHSLINCSSLFDVNTQLYLSRKITVRKEKSKQLTIAMYESFVQQLFIQYAKLSEVLNDISDNDSISHQNKYYDLITKNGLDESYAPLLDLLKKINNSSVKTLRDKIFAHPFKETKKIIALSPHIAVEEVYKTLRELCDEEKKDKYDKEERKVLFFTNNYLIKGENSKKHLYIIYNFMKNIRKKTFFDIDPYIYLKREDSIDMINMCIKMSSTSIIKENMLDIK